MTLITPTPPESPSPTPSPANCRQTLDSMTNWRTQGSLCQTSSPAKPPPSALTLHSHLSPCFLFIPLQTNARTRRLLDNNPRLQAPAWLWGAKSPPFFLQVNTERPLLSWAVITYLNKTALLVLKLPPDRSPPKWIPYLDKAAKVVPCSSAPPKKIYSVCFSALKLLANSHDVPSKRSAVSCQ